MAVPFGLLRTSDLIVDELYEGGTSKNASDDPISRLVGVGNQGGFRLKGKVGSPSVIVLYTDLAQPNWPDFLDTEAGIFTYYGDNRKPGKDIHDTQHFGNKILKGLFDNLHSNNRSSIPPIFVFSKAGKGRDVIFRGLAVPGAAKLSQTEDLVAIWKSQAGKRFQNYKALFTILDVRCITRQWLTDIGEGNWLTPNAPISWINWIRRGKYEPLVAQKTLSYRSVQEQLPQKGLHEALVLEVIEYFAQHPRKQYAFEACAADLVRRMDPHIRNVVVTRPWRDGGRDALGEYEIGLATNSIKVEFALEAKCHNLRSGSGVHETSRLISRLRHRQFGIFVTTSYVNMQAYKEIVDDDHPVVIISGEDIANILIVGLSITTVDALRKWLIAQFP